MAGANWTRKDYRVIAEELRSRKPYTDFKSSREVLGEFVRWQADVHAWARVCHDNAKFTTNGNRNFDAEMFYKEATK